VTERSPAAAAPLSIITARSGPGTIRVHLAGEIDMATAPQLRVALLAVIAEAAPQTEVRVDLGRVAFIDAIGIGVLVRGREAARQAGVGFSVDNPRGIVLRIIEVLDLVDALRVTPARHRSPRS
jgi:anti-sigma B factor antagonist